MQLVRVVTLLAGVASCGADPSTSPTVAGHDSDGPTFSSGVVDADGQAFTTITTDKSDYQPGERVTIRGEGFLPRESITLVIAEDPQVHAPDTLAAESNSEGSLVNSTFVIEEHHRDMQFIVTATGLTSGRSADTRFSDGAFAGITASPTPFSPMTSPGANDATDIRICAAAGQPTGLAEVKINIATFFFSTPVQSLAYNDLEPGDCGQPVPWNGRDAGGRFVPSGAYRVSASATDPSTGRRVFSGEVQVRVDNAVPAITVDPIATLTQLTAFTFTGKWEDGFGSGFSSSKLWVIRHADGATVLTAEFRLLSGTWDYQTFVSPAWGAGSFTVRVELTDRALNVGTAERQFSVVTPCTPPSLITQPQGVTALIGEPIRLTAAATGTAPLVYQWQRNSGNIVGATSAAFEIAAAQLTDAGIYAVQVSNGCGTVSSAEAPVAVHYPFAGFYPPVDNSSSGDVLWNVVAGGRAIPIKFQLGGDRGFDIFADGPKVIPIGCDTGPSDAIEETTAATQSGLQFDPLSQQYTYVWKTEKAWGGQCRMFSLALKDGSSHVAYFRFTR